MTTLYIAWQDPKDRRWYPVGHLSFDGEAYRFVYTKGAQRSPNFIPFGRMLDLGACPRKKSLKDKVLEPRRGDFKISHFLETRVLTGDQNFLEFLENP